MKKLLAIILALAMVLSLAACGSQDAAPETKAPSTDSPTGKEDVTIRFYNYALSEVAKASWWEGVIADFEAKYDWITVEPIVVDYNSMITTLTNDLAAGLSADIIYGEVTWVPSLADGGFIQKADDVLSEEFFNGYNPDSLKCFEYLDGVYGVPHYMTNWMIFVNKDLVEGAGLKMEDFPTTEDGLKQWIETLSQHYKDDPNISTIFGVATAEVPASGSCLNSLYTAFGGTLLNEDGTLADLKAEPNHTAMAETLDFCNYLISNGYTQENQKLKDYRSAFGAGNVCMYIDESWGYAQIDNDSTSAKDFTVSAPLPTTMGTNGQGKSLLESHCFLLGADMDDATKEAVDLFLQYVNTTEVTGYYLNNIGLAFPVHQQMADFEISPILEGAAKGIDNVTSQTAIPSIISVQTQLASSVLNHTINGMSIEDTIDDYIQQAEYYINQ